MTERTLEIRLAVIQKMAPPHPKDSLYRWLTSVYRLRRTLGDARVELRRLAKKMKLKVGDVLLRAIIEKTAGEHVTAKMKSKYAVVLEKALNDRVKSKSLRRFIENAGGINACCSKSNSGD